MVRPPCCGKLNVKRGLWTAEEDTKILAYVSKHGTGNWTDVPKKAGLRRCGKSCRLRWTNYLRPDLKHDNFTPQEEEMIVRLHAAIGSRWSIIAQQLPGRTDNAVKNYWNSKLKKKLTEMGIDPVTHKPFSQILADYGNIGGFPKSTRIGSLNRDLKNAFLFKPQTQQHPQPHRFSIKSPKTQLIIQPTDDSSNDSMDLLAQLQSIKLVTEASTSTHYVDNTMSHIFGEGSSFSCSSSTSSTCSSAAGQEPTTTFSWRDFLLEDAFLPVDGPQEEEHLLAQCDDVEFHCGVLRSGTYQQIPTSNGSFVETMLDQDNQMMPEFPQLLDEPFYY